MIGRHPVPLTPQQIADIKASNARLIEIAEMHEIGLTTVQCIRNGTWERQREARSGMIDRTTGSIIGLELNAFRVRGER